MPSAENFPQKNERPLGGAAARAWGMEGTAIRSQFGRSGRSAALASSRTTHRSKQVTTVVPPQKTLTTSHYVPSLHPTGSAVDSSPGSFLPVPSSPPPAALRSTEVPAPFLVHPPNSHGPILNSGPPPTVLQTPIAFVWLVAAAPRAQPTASVLCQKANRALSPAIRFAVCVLLRGSSCLSCWLPAALAAGLPFFDASPGRRAPVPPRSGSWSGDGLVRHRQARPEIAGRQTPGPKARTAALGQRRFLGRAPSDAAADGWRRSAVGPRSRTLLWRRRFWT